MSNLANALDKVIAGEKMQATRSAVSSEALLHSNNACLTGFMAALPITPTKESVKKSPNVKIAFAKV